VASILTVFLKKFFIGVITWSDGDDIKDSEEGAVFTLKNCRTCNEEVFELSLNSGRYLELWGIEGPQIPYPHTNLLV